MADLLDVVAQITNPNEQLYVVSDGKQRINDEEAELLDKTIQHSLDQGIETPRQMT